MGKVDYDKEKIEEVIASLRENGGNIKKTARDTQTPVASIRQIMISEEIEVKPENKRIMNTAIDKKNEVITAEIIDENEGFDEMETRFMKKIYKLREAYLDKLLDIVDFEMDPKITKEVMDVANRIIEEKKSEGIMTKSSSILEEIQKRMISKK